MIKWFVLSATLIFGMDACAVEVDPQQKTEYVQVESRILVENAGGMPSLCRAGNGQLLFAYATHWEPVPVGGEIRLMRSDDNGKTWSEAETIVRPKGPEFSVQFWSGLHHMPDGSLLLGYHQAHYQRRANVAATEQNPARIWDLTNIHNADNNRRKIEPYIVRSNDHGRSWSRPQRLAPGLPWCGVMGRPVTLPDGSVVQPLIGPDPGGRGPQATLCIRTTDNGRTWSEPALIAGGPEGYNEVTLAATAEGELLAILRERIVGPRRLFWQTRSRDKGKTWDAPTETKLYGKMPDMLVLPSGRILLAVASVDCMDGGLVYSGPPNSSYAGLFISDDHGRSWRRDVMFTTDNLDQIIPFDAPVLTTLEKDRILAIAFSADRKYKGDPLLGWTRGMHYTLHLLAPSKQ